MRSSANKIISIFFLLTWIFIGNFIFLNLFLAVLLDGFGDPEILQMKDDIEDELLELNTLLMEKREFYIKKNKSVKKNIDDNQEVFDKLYKKSVFKKEADEDVNSPTEFPVKKVKKTQGVIVMDTQYMMDQQCFEEKYFQ